MAATMKTKAITLTDAAAARVRTIMAQRTTPAIGLRIGLKTKGCSGLSYWMEFAEATSQLDEVIEEKGVTILIESKAQMFVFGTELDYVEDALKSGFVFRNPNEKGRCGCGESFHI